MVIPDTESSQKAALLEAAARMVAADGVEGLSIRKLAADVGTSTMGVYTWFGSKPEVLRAVYREAFARFDSCLREVPVTDDPVHDLAELGWAYRRHARANPFLYQVMFGSSSTLFDPDEDDVALALGTFQILVEAVGRCVEAGRMNCDPELGARQIWAAAHGAVSLELVAMTPWDRDQAASYATLMGTIFFGLGGKVEGER